MSRNFLKNEEYLNINQKAQLRFSELKRKMKLDLGIPFIEEAIEEGTGAKVKIDREKVEALLNGEIKTIPELDKYVIENPPVNAFKNLENIGSKVENIFEWIDSLELDPKLSLAIGMIISYKNTNNLEDLQKAIATLYDCYNGV